jgi:hypothetical protein
MLTERWLISMFVACLHPRSPQDSRFRRGAVLKLSDTQFDGTQPQRYMMIWEIETDNLPAVFADVNARLKDGRTVFTDAFDPAYNSITMSPITRRVTADEVQGKGVDEVGAISKGK